jgi:ParB family chromosome partitioning protein
MAAALVENLQRQDLDAIEEADGYNRLLDEFGLTQEQLGGLVGKSRSHVTNTLRLLNLPAAVRAHVQSGALSPGHARALLVHKDPEAAAALVIARGLNVRQTEALASRPDRKPKQPDEDTRALERYLSLQTGLKTTITTRGNGGVAHIAYRNLDQLDSLIDRLVTTKTQLIQDGE